MTRPFLIGALCALVAVLIACPFWMEFRRTGEWWFAAMSGVVALCCFALAWIHAGRKVTEQ